jgi:predicted RNase H-like HicB family nuclease
MKNRSAKTLEEYLRAPYSRVLIPDEESGTFTAEILEFPGCISQGDTAEEAYKNLEAAAKAWIEAALDLGQEIPEPSYTQNYGGKIALRLPHSLHRKAAQMAEHDGTSLNQFLVAAVAEKVGASNLYQSIVEKLEHTLAPPKIFVLFSSTLSRCTSATSETVVGTWLKMQEIKQSATNTNKDNLALRARLVS